MHCPNCGHRQASSEVRFCKHCGLALDEVRQALTAALRDGEAESEPRPKNQPRSSSMPVIPKELIWQFRFFLLLPVILILMVLQLVLGVHFVPDKLFFGALAFVFFGFLLSVLIPLAFGKTTISRRSDKIQPGESSPLEAQLGGARLAALSPAQGLAVTEFVRRRVKTAELVTPPSVTEHTTRSLGEHKVDPD